MSAVAGLGMALIGSAQPAVAAPAGDEPAPEIVRDVHLYDVDCVSAAVCVAVGVNHYRESVAVPDDYPALTVKDRPLVALKTSNGWVEMDFPAIPQASDLFTAGEADEVSCVPTARPISMRNTYCVLTGYYRAYSTYARDYFEHGPLTAVWNGSGWRLLEKPLRQNLSTTEHLDVECVAARTCYSLMRRPKDPNNFRFGTWDGRQWTSSQLTRPDELGAGEFGTRYMQSLSCWAVRRCVAAGAERVDAPRRYRPIAGLLGATGWQVDRLPGGGIGAVDCLSASRCVTVGQDQSKIGSPRSGEWRVVPMRGTHGSFADVDCASASSCLAVGGAGGLRAAQQLVGGRWTSATPPTPGAASSSVAAVSCPRADLCYATASSTLWNADEVLLERRGRTWQHVAVALKPYLPPA